MITSVQPQSLAFPPRLLHDPSPEGSPGGNRLFRPRSLRYLPCSAPRRRPAESRNSGRPKGRLSRRDNRKLERIENKKRRVEHHTTKQRQQRKRPAQKEHEDVPVAKKPRVSAPRLEAKASSPKPKKNTPLQKLAGNFSGSSGLPKTQEEDKEDAYIYYLEGKLGWKKNGAKTSAYGSGLADDGLDGIHVLPCCFGLFD